MDDNKLTDKEIIVLLGATGAFVFSHWVLIAYLMHRMN